MPDPKTLSPETLALIAQANSSTAASDAADQDEADKAGALAAATKAHDDSVTAENTAHNQRLGDAYAALTALAKEWNAPLPPLPTVG